MHRDTIEVNDMWTAPIEIVSRDKRKLTLQVDGAPMTYDAVLKAWKNDREFRFFFSEQLADVDFSAFRWETPPITSATRDQRFECVVVESPALSTEADDQPFAEQFAKAPGSDVVTFTNLGADATLVVPTPWGPDHNAYGHLAAFLRIGPGVQHSALWVAVGDAMQKRISDKPVWLSTAGAGVAWLHVRLDDYPKYYHHTPYRDVAGLR